MFIVLVLVLSKMKQYQNERDMEAHTTKNELVLKDYIEMRPRVEINLF